MKKYTIIGVIVLMSISLLGVVGLQLYWINDAIKVKQAQFDHAVNEALISTVDKLETREAVSVVTDKMQALRKPVQADTQTIAQPKPTPLKQAPAKAKQAKPASAKSNAPQEPPLTPNPPQRVTWKHKTPTLKKGRTWVKLASGDTVIVKDARFTHTSSTRYHTGVKHPLPGQIQVITDPKQAAHIIKKTSPTYQIALSADSIALQFRDYNRVMDFSVDTLRLLAARLDSIHTFKRITAQTNANEFSAVEVRNDSIFLFRKGAGRPVYVSSSAESEGAILKLYSSTNSKAAEQRALTERTNKFIVEKPAKATEPAKEKTNYKTTQKQQQELLPKKTATEKLEQKTEKLNDVVQKMVVEYVAKDEPLQKRLNLDTLHNLLQTELQKQGINLPFGYWVVSGQKDTIAAKNVAPYTDASLPKYKASLFPNDIFAKSDYLDLYFPNSKNYAIQSLWGMLALSGFFTLVIIATFGTTIYIIYKQKKLSEMKNDFINNMTHEFKTPIATISLATDSIANPKVYENPDKIQYYTNIIRQENKRMNTQVENVLQIALLEKNEFKMKLEPVDVHLLIVKAIESIKLQVEQRMGQINVQLDALKHELKSDEVHLYNVICNLLDNANKYSPASPEISLTTRNVDGGILIAVDDKGMGMSKDTQQRVFEKFYRVPTGNLHNVKGFGLGLSYVKAIVQAHHGNIRLWSEPGKGSRFEIFLPMN